MTKFAAIQARAQHRKGGADVLAKLLPPKPDRAKLHAGLEGIRNWDMGGFVIDYSGQPPHVGSSFIDLGVLGNAGRFIG